MKKNFRRVVSLLLALVMAMSLAVSAAAEYGEEEDAVTGGMIPPGLHNFMRVNTYTEGQYSDVPSTHTFSENAKAAYEFDIMQGYGTTFGVSNNITRLASIIIACRLNCIYYEGENRIDEAYSGTTQERYMAYAKDFGILCNFDDVSKSATRAEFAAILASAFPEDALKAINTVEDGAIPDVSATAKYADAIYLLYRAGILNGSDAKGTFYPASNINRGAACAIATRMCDESLRKNVTLVKAPDNTKPEEVVSQNRADYVVTQGDYKGLLKPYFSRQKEVEALSLIKLGEDSKGVYVTFTAPSMPDVIKNEFTFEFTGIVYNSKGYYFADNAKVDGLKAGETKTVYFVSYQDTGVKSRQIAEMRLAVMINNSTGYQHMFVRSISTSDKTTAYAKFDIGQADNVKFDSTSIWKGIGK